MQAAGLAMLGLVALILMVTGLPVFVVLIGVSVLFAGLGLALGLFEPAILMALAPRLIGLLESDLLQALPLYVLMGVLLDRLPLAHILFRGGTELFRRSPAAPLLSAIGLGALIAPMNGSVGASVAILGKVVAPRLEESGVAPAQGLAAICVASTFGVVVPPSLVLLLLGDAMMRAHTEALNASGVMARIVNTQDVFKGALLPAGLFLLLSLAVGWAVGRNQPKREAERLTLAGRWVAGITLTCLLALLGGVAAGYFYAVEAAAMGAFALLAAGLASGRMGLPVMREVLNDTMATTGALFALFVGATSFTLVFRIFGTDRLLAEAISLLPGGATGAALGVLVLLGLCSLVLDAFEIIFVIVPVIMPPLLILVPDVVWVSVLTLLVLQASFLLPPLGYAVMMARRTAPRFVSTGHLMRALAPFVAAQLLVLALVAGFPVLVHLTESAPKPPPVVPVEEPQDNGKGLYEN